jgi:membrane-bound serine protease (ClpP class)
MVKKWIFNAIVFILIACGLFGLVSKLSAQSPLQNIAILLDIKGGIGPATQDFIHRSFRKALDQYARLIILRMDTPGGLDKSMRGIIQDILASSIPVIAYVAPSGARAASAGTYILYASHLAVMAPGTNLGAATPVNIGGPSAAAEKAKTKSLSAEELKAINDAKAYIRSLAQLRGRNVIWAEKAVSEAASLSASEALQMHVINYIAQDIPDLLQKANGMQVKINNANITIDSKNLQVQSISPDWRTKFLAIITDPSVAYILLMIGFYGLFFEFANPGFIMPGVAGAIAVLLALYAFQLLPVSYVGLGLILLAIVFFVSEAFVTSFGALAIGGVISFVMGSILLMKTDVIGFGIPVYLIVLVSVVTAAFFLIILNLAWRSRRRPIVSGREAVIGKIGIVSISDQHIWVQIAGERWQGKSDMPLTNGEKVIVVALEGLICVVKPLEKKS